MQTMSQSESESESINNGFWFGASQPKDLFQRMIQVEQPQAQPRNYGSIMEDEQSSSQSAQSIEGSPDSTVEHERSLNAQRTRKTEVNHERLSTAQRTKRAEVKHERSSNARKTKRTEFKHKRQSTAQKTKGIKKEFKPRTGHTMQSIVQKFWMQITKAHILKNLESKNLTIINNGFQRIGKIYYLPKDKKFLGLTELNELVKTSELEKNQWKNVLDLTQSDRYINDPKNKLGTSKHFDKYPQKVKELLQALGKDILKIIMRSVRRMILRCSDGFEITQYLDQEAKTDLHELEKKSEYEQLLEKYFLDSQLNKSMRKQRRIPDLMQNH